MNLLIIIIIFIIVMIDQLSKFLTNLYIPIGEKFLIIKNFLYFNHLTNEGAAFSILKNKTTFLIFFSFISLLFIYYYLIKGKELNILEKVAYSFLIGGICGNLIDRILYNKVTDFIAIELFNYNFPVFNIADIFIFLGAAIMLSMMVFKGEENGKKYYRL